MTTRHMLTAVSAALALASVACTTSRDQQAADSTNGSMPHAALATGATTSTMPGMTNTMGTMGNTGMTAMMDEMRQHLHTMRTASPDSLKAILPTHRQMVANMMATMNTEMREMHMPGDAAWQATVDSLRSDLIHLPTMNTAEIQAFMSAHAQRVTHLMQMHHDMMANMKMQ